MKLNISRGKNDRGFTTLKFDDYYGQHCSLQESSLATEQAIWLGVDNTGNSVSGPFGQRNEYVMARMHLTEDQVKILVTELLEWITTGNLREKD